MTPRWLPETAKEGLTAPQHCGVSLRHFQTHIAPKVTPRDAHGKKVYDRHELDSYMEQLRPWADRKLEAAA